MNILVQSVQSLELGIDEVVKSIMYHCLEGLVGKDTQTGKFFYQPMDVGHGLPKPIEMADDDPRLELNEALKVIRKFYNLKEENLNPKVKTKKKKNSGEPSPKNVVSLDFKSLGEKLGGKK